MTAFIAHIATAPRRWLIAGVLCCLSLGSLTAASAQGIETVSLREALLQIEPAVVAILAVYENGDANQGTGFIVREDGLLITCEHVIRDATTIEIHWSSNLDRPAETATVLARDAEHDIALLQLTGTGYPVLPLAQDEEPQVGDAVAAIGFPVGDILGLTDLSVTRGIVSALRRNIDGSLELVQTDAPITVGNSGGPLFDLDAGGVIGVVRAKGVEELQGINFASAVDTLRLSFPQMTSDSAPPITRASAKLLGGESQPKPTAAPAVSAMPQLFEPRSYFGLAGYVVEVDIDRSPRTLLGWGIHQVRRTATRRTRTITPQ